MMATKIKSVIIPETMSRKMKRASTLPAAVEALAGHSGKLSNIYQLKLGATFTRSFRLTQGPSTSQDGSLCSPSCFARDDNSKQDSLAPLGMTIQTRNTSQIALLL